MRNVGNLRDAALKVNLSLTTIDRWVVTSAN